MPLETPQAATLADIERYINEGQKETIERIVEGLATGSTLIEDEALTRALEYLSTHRQAA